MFAAAREGCGFIKFMKIVPPFFFKKRQNRYNNYDFLQIFDFRRLFNLTEPVCSEHIATFNVLRGGFWLMEHEHSPECGCGDSNIVTIEFEDGIEVECEILGTFEANGKEYIALLKQDESEDILIYGFKEHEDDIELIDIEDEEEFNIAAEVLDELLGDEL